jgi:hypothetical protein
MRIISAPRRSGTLTGSQEEAIHAGSRHGGIGLVSIGISEALIAVVVLIAVVFGVWKAAKLIWAAFSN